MWLPLFVLLAGCGGCPGDAPDVGTAEVAPSAPPPVLDELELGPAFVASAWGPHVTADQAKRFAALGREAADREASRRKALGDAQQALRHAVEAEADEATVNGAADALVAAEEALIEEQRATLVALYGVLDTGRRAAGPGAPPLLGTLLTRSALRAGPNPFARLPLAGLDDAEATEARRLELQVQTCQGSWEQAGANALARLGELDLREAAWVAAYDDVAEHAAEAYRPCRIDAVRQFAGFVRRLPPDRRGPVLSDDAFLGALRPQIQVAPH